MTAATTSTKPEQRHSRLLPRLAGGLLVAGVLLMAGIAGAAPGFAPLPTATAERGVPAIQNYDSTSYGGGSQNWAVTQGPDGVIYIGNVSDGVLAFDGARWRRIPVANQFVVRSLATAPDGRIYVGTVGDFGYLQPDGSGGMRYVSLLDKLPSDARNFSDVWSIFTTGSDVYFATLTALFHLHDGRISAIKPATSFHLGFMVDDKLYIREVGIGLMRVSGDKLELLPGGKRFADERIYALLPWRGPAATPGELLVATRSHGWFLYTNGKIHPWATEADAALNQAAIYQAIWLADGRLAVATLRGGVFLLDTQGRLLGHLDRASGLATDVVFALYQDRQHGLWLATGDGITHVNVDSPLTRFDERSGLKGSVLDIKRHNGTLYVSTTEGVFRLLAKTDGNARFEQLSGAPGQDWSFAAVDGHLLLAGNEGVFSIRRDGSVQPLLDKSESRQTLSARVLLRSRQQPARVFVAYQDGLGALRWSGNRWIDEGRIAGTQKAATSLVEDAAGHLWLSLWRGGIDRVSFPASWQGPGDARAVKIDHFEITSGLPGGQLQVVTIDGRVLVLSNAGIYRFDETTQQFEPDPEFNGLFPDGPREIDALHRGHDGRLWMYTVNVRTGIKQTGYVSRGNGKWHWHVSPLQPLDGVSVSALHDDPGGVLWIGCERSLFRYDPARQPAHDPRFRVLIRRVSSRGGNLLPIQPPGAAVPEIPFARNALRFNFAAPCYTNVDANQFTVMLQGVDSGWSNWSSDTYRDYTNLHEGLYRLRVRARNVYGMQTPETDFEFRVLPPWYRTGWAWMAWIASGVLLLGLFLRWRSATLRRRNSELVALVDLRTTELAQANQALQSSNEKLAEQSVTDPLTGLKNRRYLYDHLTHDVAMARRNCRDRQTGRNEPPLNSGILFLMADIDHFKGINDEHGHAAGDRVLQQIRDVLLSVTRETDIAIRWGGEEFLIVARFALPDTGPQFAERIRTAVAAHRFDVGDGRFIRLTCSVGFATYPTLQDEPDQLAWSQVVNLADECLYAAKHHGRNAWAGVMPLASPPDREIQEALREALAQPPGSGSLRVETSWTRVSVD